MAEHGGEEEGELELGEAVLPSFTSQPPPWILGHRGAPRDAPENTLASLRRALELGADGVEYDVRACSSGEALLLHDEHLERTTDGSGPVRDLDLRQVGELDAGAWFHRRFRGEPLPLLHEALALGSWRRGSGSPDGSQGGESDRGRMHMIELKEASLVAELAELLEELGPGERPTVRVASFQRDVVLEAGEHGLPAMLLARRATEEDRRFVRDRRVTAFGVGPHGWHTPAAAADWSFCERWAWAVDDPEELLQLMRLPLFGLNTNEPVRALALRELVRLVPDQGGSHPLQLPVLEVIPEALDAETRGRGEWFGRWRPVVGLTNPLPVPVQARVGIFPRGGAFEIAGLPGRALGLPAHSTVELPFELSGGGRQPCPDPLFAVELRYPAFDGHSPGRLLLDGPLRRIRIAHADGLARRLTMLAESPDDPPASVTVLRRRDQLLLSIENAGDLEDPHLVARIDGELVRGGAGLRLVLPEDFDRREGGVPFSCGIEGRRGGLPGLRRFAGGVPEGLEQGPQGRLCGLGSA